jgi:DNA-3-methyladenine glycosylase II
MVRTTESLSHSLKALAEREEAFAKVLDTHGHPEPRTSEPGVETLLRTIVGQQVSVAAARSMWNKLTAKFGQPIELKAMLASSDEAMREAGCPGKGRLSPQPCWLVLSGGSTSPTCQRTMKKRSPSLSDQGIGRWSAEIYLLFAEGRHDIWPAGDLAVQIEIGKLMGLEGKPTEKQLRELAKAGGHRGAAAVLPAQL